LKRNLTDLTTESFDIVVVGGGIFGACASWEAVLRGHSVALVEKEDFCHATSANHYKMVHSGVRYLQHADFFRLRESSKERTVLLRIAPHLVQNLPIMIPTYGHGIRGKAFLGTGMLVFDLLTIDRNTALSPSRKIPRSRFLSVKDVIDQYPGVKKAGLTGAVVFDEGQMYNPPRLALSFIRSAVEKGAVAANYVKATGFLRSGSRITGITAQDELTGNQFDIQGKMVLNTAGPWAHHLLHSALDIRLDPQPTFSRDLAFVIPKRFESCFGIALATTTKDVDTIVDRGGRHLFAMPWRDYTLIGVWHKVFNRSPDELDLEEKELEGYVSEVNAAYPGLIDSQADIRIVNMGLTLFGEEEKQGYRQLSFGKRSQIIDHALSHKLEGLVTLIGVRATMARIMAAKVFDLIAVRMGRDGSKSDSSRIPIFGGDLDDFASFEAAVQKRLSNHIKAEQITALVRNYGTRYADVLKYADSDPALYETLEGSTVLKAEIVHAVRDEMVQKLTDVVMRRTDLGSASAPSTEALKTCASITGEELGWDQKEREGEIQEVLQLYPYRKH